MIKLEELIRVVDKKLKQIFLPLVVAGGVVLGGLGLTNMAEARINSLSGFAKTSTGAPASGSDGHRVFVQKFPSGTSKTITPTTGGEFSISRLEVGDFILEDSVLFHLYNMNAPSESSNMVYIVKDTFPGQSANPYVPEIYEDNSAVPNRAYGLCLREVFSPVPGQKFLEFFLRKNPLNRDTVLTATSNTADTFHLNLEYLVQNANEGDIVDLHAFVNDSVYADTSAVVQRQIGRFLNDAMRATDTLNLQIHQQQLCDVGVSKILAPSDTVDTGQVIDPRAEVQNYGTVRADGTARMRIGLNWSDPETLSLAPGQIDTINFAQWTAQNRGNNPVRCSTEVAGDQDPSNDKAVGKVFVRVADAEAYRILAPTGTIYINSTMTPQVQARNAGNVPIDILVCDTIWKERSQPPRWAGTPENLVKVQPGEIKTVQFAPQYTPTDTGIWYTEMRVVAPGENPLLKGNNSWDNKLEKKINQHLHNPILARFEERAKEVGPDSSFQLTYSFSDAGGNRVYQATARIRTDEYGNLNMEDVLKDPSLLNALIPPTDSLYKLAQERWISDHAHYSNTPMLGQLKYQLFRENVAQPDITKPYVPLDTQKLREQVRDQLKKK